MKNKKTLLLCFIGIFLHIPLTIVAQTITIFEIERHHNKDVGIAYSTGVPDDTTTILVFQQNAPSRFNAPSIPQFAIMGKNQKFYMGVGGYVKATMSMDVNGSINNPGYFITNLIPIPGVEGNKGLFQLNANQTTLFYNLVSKKHGRWKFGAYLNANFRGANYSLKLQDAYVTFGGFQMGYTTSLFTDEAAIPPTIDAEGPSGLTYKYANTFNYTQPIGSHVSIAIGVEMPTIDMTVESGFQSEIYQKIPDVPMFIQYAWGQNNSSHIRVSGVIRNMQYRNLIDSDNKVCSSIGGQVSGVATIAKKLTVFGQMAYGQGLATYIQDINGLNLAFLPDWNNASANSYNGDMVPTDASGGYLGLQYQISNTTFLSCTYSLDWVDLPKQFTSPNAYYEGQYLSANIFYEPIPNVNLAMEYLWGQRKNSNGQFDQANRIQIMAQFSF